MGAIVESERSIASVVQDVMGNLSRIVRAEVRLAKVEAADQLSTLSHSVGGAAKLLVTGAAIAQLALGFLLLAGVRLLETVVSPWIAALVVAVAAGVVGLAMVSAGVKHLKGISLPPSKAGESLKEMAR